MEYDMKSQWVEDGFHLTKAGQEISTPEKGRGGDFVIYLPSPLCFARLIRSPSGERFSMYH